jgi:hypothetical protein
MKLKYIVGLLFFISHADRVVGAVITYQLNGGRFGDNIRSFTQAYWLSYKYQLPLFFVPFPGSELLMAHTLFGHWKPAIEQQFDYIKIFDSSDEVVINRNNNTLFVTTYYCLVDIDWQDQAFLAAVREVLRPCVKITLPSDIYDSVVMHVRRGGEFNADSNKVKRRRPLHFPNLEYYAQALHILLEYVQGQHTVYLLTDDEAPQVLAADIKKLLSPDDSARIQLVWREKNNHHNAHVLEDFLCMQLGRYLIRPQSNFSLYAQRLGTHHIVIRPKRGKSGNPWGIVTNGQLDIRTQNGVQSREFLF